jgi:predicted DNA-binding transcriptional regulator AlpA
VGETAVEFDDWADAFNLVVPEGELPMPKSKSIRSALGLGWQSILPVAKGQVTLDEALTQASKGRLAAGATDCGYDSEFVSVAEIANLSRGGINAARKKTMKPSFPTPALQLGRLRVWLRSDVVAHLDGEPVPKRPAFFLQDDYLAMHDVCQHVGLSPSSIHHRDCPSPEPEGKVAGKLYWRKDSVIKWVNENQELIALRLASKPRGRPRKQT